jgi:hypothetical protein
MTEAKTLTAKLKNRFLVIIRNEENFAVSASFRLSVAAGIGLILLIMIFTGGLTLLVSEKLIPTIIGKKDKEIEQLMQILDISEKVDSLAFEINRRDLYMANLRRLFYGSDLGLDEEMIQALAGSGSGAFRYDVETRISDLDSLFRREMEEGDFGIITTGLLLEEGMGEIFFFPPVTGVITAPFDVPSGHYGVDIASKTNEPIKAIADGTVILASWTQDSGYVVAIQHKGNLLSFYKHNSVLLKKVGSFVTAGEAIAIIGNSGEFTDGPHLHLEIWHNGNPINPEQIISF